MILSRNSSTNKYENVSVNNRLRVTLKSDTAHVYTALNKFVIYCSTSGSTGCKCTIQGLTKNNYDAGNNSWTTFADGVDISGWSGFNVINTSSITTYGNNGSQYIQLRFIFYCGGNSSMETYGGLSIINIYGFGGVGWTTPSNMAKWGQLYSYDAGQNVFFPANVAAKTISVDTINGQTLGNAIMRQNTSTGDVILGSTVRQLRLWGNGDRPTYSKDDGASYKNLALLSDIPGIATSSVAGLVKSSTTGTTSNRDYKVQVNTDGTMKVNVPWTDNNTTYSAGTGLSLSGTTFSVSSANVSTMMNLLSEGSSDPTDNDYYISQWAGGGTTTTTYHRRPVSKLYNYMKGKFDSIYQAKGSYAASSHTHDYLPLTGGTLTGNLSLKEYKNILLRPNNSGYTSGIGYDTHGNECIALWAKNSVTRLRWNAGVDMSELTSGKMMTITPDFEISKADGTAKGYIAGQQIIHSGNIGSQNVNYANSAGSVAWTNVSGRPSSLPASDVYAWAKASTKPSYTASEVGALSLSGGTMTGTISYKGTKATYGMIKWIDNTGDIYGNGIRIGGGGATIIGGGESADLPSVSGGDEILYLMNDENIDFYSNCQDGLSSAKHMTFD